MNIVESVVARIEDRLLETKNPCKLYKTKDRAEAMGKKLSEEMGRYFGTHPAQYIVVYVPSVDRYTPAFNINEIVSRPDALGGYVGAIADKGFFQF